jgi:arylsulfatase
MSFAPSLVDPDAPTVHTEQYYECVGHRAFYRDGWAAVTYRIHRTPYSEDCWELFNVAEDLNELNDLSTRHPEKLAELKEAWEEAAWRNRVFPLNEGTELMRAVLPPEDERLTRPVRIVPGTPTLERVRSRRLIGGRSFRIDVRLDHRPGDEGVLVAHGGQEAGYVLYLEDGQLHLEMNEDGHPKPFPPAPIGDCSAITVDVTAPGERRWDVKVIVDGKTVSEGVWTELTREFLPFEGIDVGIDRRSPVSWSLYERRGCFPYTGNLIDVVYTPGEYAPDAPEVRIEDMRAIGLALE